MTLLPPSPSENEYKGCVDKTNRCGNGCNPNNDPSLSTSVCIDNKPMQWRIEKDEAVIMIGRTPPTTKYYSITSYLMSQYYNQSSRIKEANFTTWTQSVAVSCPNGPARCQKFASLGQPYNYLQGGFNKPFAIVLTASKTTYSTIQKIIVSEIPEISNVVLVPLPNDVLNLGTDNDQRDMLTMLMRVAYPKNVTAMQDYYHKTPISIMRVTPNQIENKENSYYNRGDVTFLPRTTGLMESGNVSIVPVVSHSQLIEDLNELERSIKQTHIHDSNSLTNTTGLNIVSTNDNIRSGSSTTLRSDIYAFLQPFFTTGLDCIDEGTECNGDTPDTLYPISGNIYTARGCQLIPVLTIGIASTCVLTFFLFCTITLCKSSRTSANNTKTTTKFNEMKDMVGTEKKYFSNHWCSINYAITLFASIVIASLLLLIPTFVIYGNSCDWGLAASLDSNNSQNIFIVYGINHQATGHSTYASITAYRYSRLSGIVSVSSEEGYENSANVYLKNGSLHRSSQFLFAYIFARDCKNLKYCYEVSFDALPENEFIFWIERMYVNPKSKTGPDAMESIMARVMHIW